MLAEILKQLPFKVIRYEAVAGGDINSAYHLYAGDEQFFLKVNKAATYPSMLKAEAAGLSELANHSSLTVPAIICQGEAGGKQYLVMDWLERIGTTVTAMQNFGGSLAMMHKQPQPLWLARK